MAQQESRNRNLTVIVNGKAARVRLLGETATRCNVAFVTGPGTQQLLKNLFNDAAISRVDASVDGLYLPPPSDIREEDLLPTSYRASIGIPEPRIVVPDLSSNASRRERIEWGALLHHEFAHSKGAGEYEAYHAQDRYLARNGLPVRFPDDEALFSHLRDSPIYGEQVEWDARLYSALTLSGDGG